jgi:sodium/potassium-transporting ATPase subunit alpha
MYFRAYYEPEDMHLPINERRIKSDATEAALFKFSCEKLGEPEDLRRSYPKVCEIPFNSENKWMLTVHEYEHSQGTYRIFIKGAPEKVWKLCKFLKVNDRVKIYLCSYILNKKNKKG